MTGRQASCAGTGVAETRAVLLRAGVVIAGYLLYAALALTAPTQEVASATPASSGSADEGLGVWRAHSCQSCHSLYGLGGHTGPDLTNVTERRPPGYVEAIVRSGLPGMPPVELGDSDAASLAAFLAGVSATGVYPPRSHKTPVFGERR